MDFWGKRKWQVHRTWGRNMPGVFKEQWMNEHQEMPWGWSQRGMRGSVKMAWGLTGDSGKCRKFGFYTKLNSQALKKLNNEK